ncbi:MAG TPA: signal peptide prediction, partial [Candidatus Eisenbacteria bacterium]
GLLLAALALRGGRLAVAGGVLQATGGGVRGLLRGFPVRGRVLAVTLGHVVLASDEATMAEVREHELAHVRQYALWGPLFLPAYAAASLIAFARRRDPYLENAFERDAFRRG